MSRCSEGHFSMYQLRTKFSIVSGGPCLKRCPMHPRFGISALEPELLVYKVSVVLLVGLSVCRPMKSASNLPADGLISVLRERSHFRSL